MKLDILTKALRQYVLSAECAEYDRPHAFDALIECIQTEERYADRDLCKDTVCVIPSLCLTDAINLIAYDDFGRLAKPRGGNVPFDVFAVAARKYTALEQLTNEQLAGGYYYISDLWHDNEANGEHGQDGTFKRDNAYYNKTASEYLNKYSSCLRQARMYVQAYHLTNEDVLEPEELAQLKQLLDDIHALVG